MIKIIICWMSALRLKHPSPELSLKLLFLTSCLRSSARSASAASAVTAPVVVTPCLRFPARDINAAAAVVADDVRFRDQEVSCAQRTSRQALAPPRPLGVHSEVSRCSSRHSFFAWKLVVSCLTCTDQSVSETCGATSSVWLLSMPAARAREAHRRRCPTVTAHDTPVCEALYKLRCVDLSAHRCRRSSCIADLLVALFRIPLAALIAHSCSDPLAALIVHSCLDLPWTCGPLRWMHLQGRIGKLTSRLPRVASSH